MGMASIKPIGRRERNNTNRINVKRTHLSTWTKARRKKESISRWRKSGAKNAAKAIISL